MDYNYWLQIEEWRQYQEWLAYEDQMEWLYYCIAYSIGDVILASGI